MEDPGPAELRFSDFRMERHAEGGLWSATIKVHGRENLIKYLYGSVLGFFVETWGYGLQEYFEGYVVETVLNLPPDRFTKSIDFLANKTWMRADVDDDGTVDRSTVLENADSQARYGTSEIVMSGGQIQGLVVADQAVQGYIDLRAFPKPSADFGGATGSVYLELFCRGIAHTLSKRVYNQTADTGTQSMSSQFQDIVDAVGEFIASRRRDANTTVVTKEYDADRKALDILTNMAALGDAQFSRWLVQGTGKSCTSVKGRRLVLKQASPVVKPA
jgi:hypothetical protein